jgi:hypothetical protein
MRFAEPGTALAATIVTADDLNLIREKIIRPAARAGPSTTFQSLTRRLNDLAREKPSTTKDTKYHEGTHSFFALLGVISCFSQLSLW